ncbi:hypothetical protein QCA50_004448 [Cerrena zonata]|uniref:Uncharacterized protein n=1 Tax=Cerrena zonata TaxID=2478898 RepID=A0AAW0GHG1_9APHY
MHLGRTCHRKSTKDSRTSAEGNTEPDSEVPTRRSDESVIAPSYDDMEHIMYSRARSSSLAQLPPTKAHIDAPESMFDEGRPDVRIGGVKVAIRPGRPSKP